MSRELPYFKFFTGEWLNGDITLEDYELQGLFINVCAYYWHRECEVNYDQLAKKFRTNNLADLDPEFIKVDEESNEVTIEFLDEQYEEFATRKKKLSQAGKKGAKRKAEKKKEAENKPPLNHPSTTKEEKDKEQKKRKTIEERKTAFLESLKPYLDKYGKDLLNNFFGHWTEHGENDKKMRFEKQTSFSISRRLATWKTNEKKFNNHGSQKHTKDNRS